MLKYFRPQKDITAYEVAFLLGHVTFNPLKSLWQTGITFTDQQWADLPEEMRRHFADSASYS